MSNSELKGKLVMLGAASVGKSCLVCYYNNGIFDAQQPATIAATFIEKTVILQEPESKLNGASYTVQVLDTCGAERYAPMAPMFYRQAAMALLVVDVTSPESFKRVQSIVEEAKQQCTVLPIFALALNKCDLQNKLDMVMVQMWCDKERIQSFETSSLTGQNVQQAFMYLIKKAAQRQSESAPIEQTVHIGQKTARQCC